MPLTRFETHVVDKRDWVARFYASLARQPDEAFSGDEKAAYARSLAGDHEN